jgi:hypothetical protein
MADNQQNLDPETQKIVDAFKAFFDTDDDDDGLSDDDELRLGTDPNNRDTDGDGTNDGLEVDTGSNPTAPNLPQADFGVGHVLDSQNPFADSLQDARESGHTTGVTFLDDLDAQPLPTQNVTGDGPASGPHDTDRSVSFPDATGGAPSRLPSLDDLGNRGNLGDPFSDPFRGPDLGELIATPVSEAQTTVFLPSSDSEALSDTGGAGGSAEPPPVDGSLGLPSLDDLANPGPNVPISDLTTATPFGQGAVTTVDEAQTTVSLPRINEDAPSITGGAGGSAAAPPIDEPAEVPDYSDSFSADTSTVSAASRFAADDDQDATVDIG